MFRSALAFVFLLGPAFAQTDRATLTGTITDPSGGVVPGAVVSIKAVATQAEHSTITNSAGVYTLDFLPIGEYTNHQSERFRDGTHQILPLAGGPDSHTQ